MSDKELEKIKERKFKELLNRFFREKRASNKSSPNPKVVKVNDLNFHQIVGSNPRIVIDFWAPWCAPCRIIEPVIYELAEVFAGKVTFGRLNVDENPATAVRFGVMSIPTLIMFENAVEVDRIIGALPRRFIENKIRTAFQL